MSAGRLPVVHFANNEQQFTYLASMTGFEPTSPALVARRRPTVNHVEFPTTPGSITTLEGPVSYEPGDAIVTGTAGEQWPIGRDNFERRYKPEPGTVMGENGNYRRYSSSVAAWRIENAFTVVTSTGARLTGEAGDWLIEYGPNDRAIVAAHIFSETYDVLP